MGFTWLSKEKIKKENYNEVKTNVDNMISTLNQPSVGCAAYDVDNGGVAAFSWNHLPIGVGEVVEKQKQGKEIRDAADYIDDQNYCHAVYGSLNSTYNDANDITVCPGENNSILSGQNISYDSSDDGTVNGTNYWSNDEGRNVTINSTHYSNN